MVSYKDVIIIKRTGSNINTIKSDNSGAILNVIRKKPASRIEIAKRTGLTKSAVTIITKQMIHNGEIVEIGTEQTESGRHPIFLDIVEDHRFAAGIFLHRIKIYVCVTNLKAKTIGTVSKNIQSFSTPEQAMDWAYQAIIDILKKHNIPFKKCIGISVGSPGPLDYQSGQIISPPNFSFFHNFNVIESLSKYTDLPILLNNAPVLMALYENQLRFPELKDYIFISVDAGVGSAIITNGDLYRGNHGFSGEIGHTTIDINGESCACGNNGCLEGYITKSAICNHFNLTSFETVVDRAYCGEADALEILDYLAKRLASAIINVVNLLDLEAVIIHGELNYRCDLLIKKIQEIVNRNSIITKAHPVTVFPALTTALEDMSFTTSAVLDQYFSKNL